MGGVIGAAPGHHKAGATRCPASRRRVNKKEDRGGMLSAPSAHALSRWAGRSPTSPTDLMRRQVRGVVVQCVMPVTPVTTV